MAFATICETTWLPFRIVSPRFLLTISKGWLRDVETLGIRWPDKLERGKRKWKHSSRTDDIYVRRFSNGNLRREYAKDSTAMCTHVSVLE